MIGSKRFRKKFFFWNTVRKRWITFIDIRAFGRKSSIKLIFHASANLKSTSKGFQYLVLSFTKLFPKHVIDNCELDWMYLNVPNHSLDALFQSHFILMRFIHVFSVKLSYQRCPLEKLSVRKWKANASMDYASSSSLIFFLGFQLCLPPSPSPKPIHDQLRRRL